MESILYTQRYKETEDFMNRSIEHLNDEKHRLQSKKDKYASLIESRFEDASHEAAARAKRFVEEETSFEEQYIDFMLREFHELLNAIENLSDRRTGGRDVDARALKLWYDMYVHRKLDFTIDTSDGELEVRREADTKRLLFVGWRWHMLASWFLDHITPKLLSQPKLLQTFLSEINQRQAAADAYIQRREEEEINNIDKGIRNKYTTYRAFTQQCVTRESDTIRAKLDKVKATTTAIRNYQQLLRDIYGDKFAREVLDPSYELELKKRFMKLKDDCDEILSHTVHEREFKLTVGVKHDELLIKCTTAEGVTSWPKQDKVGTKRKCSQLE